MKTRMEPKPLKFSGTYEHDPGLPFTLVGWDMGRGLAVTRSFDELKKRYWKITHIRSGRSIRDSLGREHFWLVADSMAAARELGVLSWDRPSSDLIKDPAVLALRGKIDDIFTRNRATI